VGKDVTALEIRPGGGVVNLGKAVQLNLFAHHRRGGADLIPGNVAAWSSTDAGIGEVSRQGRLTPRAAGSVTITASYGDKQALAVFTVVADAADAG
jgi:hypothetical protein